MTDDRLRSLLRDAEGQVLRFTLTDGDEMQSEVVSSSHADTDDSVVVLRAGALPAECGWQIWFADIRSLATAGCGVHDRGQSDRAAPRYGSA